MKQTTSIRCTSPVIDLAKLSKAALEEALKKHPNVAKKIKAEAESRAAMIEKRKRGAENQAEMELEVLREKIKKVRDKRPMLKIAYCRGMVRCHYLKIATWVSFTLWC
jgi:hypothetical protein